MNFLLAAALALPLAAAEQKSCAPDGHDRQVDVIRRWDTASCTFAGYCIQIGMYFDSQTNEYKQGDGSYSYSSSCQGRQNVYYETPVYEDSCGVRSHGAERETSRDPCA